MKLTKEQITRRLHCGVMMANKEVYYGMPFELVGFKKLNTIILNGDWSGGTHHTFGDSQYAFESWKPILRPLSDLTKPIKQANYNEGKEFVPIRVIKNNIACVQELALLDMFIDGKLNILRIPHWIIDLLLEWHFVIDEPEGSYINVNDLETNPYE